MPSIAIDTLRFAEGLKAAGTPAPQADATARLFAEALAGSVGELATQAQLREGFAACERAADAMRNRLDAVEHRVDAVEHRLDAVEHRLDAVEHRLDAVEHRLDAVEHRLAAVERELSRCVLALHGQARDLAWLKGGNMLVLASLLPLLFKAFA